MSGIFKTVLYMSVIGSGAAAVLSLIKPLTVRFLSARWQYFIWVVTAVCMIVPLWKCVPQHRAREITGAFVPSAQVYTIPYGNDVSVDDDIALPPSEEGRAVQPEKRDIYELLGYVWIVGTAVFLAFAAVSYVLFLRKKRKSTIGRYGSKLFERVKREMRIKRKITVRVSGDSEPPMLVGVFFPIIYIPEGINENTALEMIFRHELTHYKHGDLIFKQLSLFVNAVHWFNPFAYMVSENIHQASEAFCDMTVIKNMNENDVRIYMETILDMAKIGVE